MHYDDDSCVLIRQFGEGDETAYLTMRRYGPGTRLQLVVTSKQRLGRQTEFEFKFDAEADWVETIGFDVEAESDFSGVFFTTRLFTIEPPEHLKDSTDVAAIDAFLESVDTVEAEIAAASRADRLHLRKAFRPEIILLTGNLQKPMEAMRACTDDLLRSWGYDVEEQKSLTRPPRLVNRLEIGKSLEYPKEMERKGIPAVLNLRLGVDENGNTLSCKLQLQLADPAFEADTCERIMQTAKFEPALDAEGRPVASYYLLSVNFMFNYKRSWQSRL
ncbi:energy transducer TonB [Paraurantiacibacter namhicola]|nr:energy transducer TonB [Paraurantiacibacter namhicola]